MQEFIINKYLKLKLIDKKTWIYVKDKPFRHCMYLLINIPTDKIEIFEDIKSIDDAERTLDSTLEENSGSSYNITPKQEFWAHCSNLQAWAESDYDTRLLHRTIAFPLLKKLYESNDPVAKKAFKEEIIKRYEEGNISVRKMLLEEFYIQKYVYQEFLEYFLTADTITYLKQLSQIIGKNLKIETEIDFFTQVSHPRLSIVIDKNGLISLDIRVNYLKLLASGLSQLKPLKELFLGTNDLRGVPEEIQNLKKLERLDLSDNYLNSISQSIQKLSSLKYLDLSKNELNEFPMVILPLDTLKHLDLGFNKISYIPESICRLRSLKYLSLARNNIDTVPDSISKLKHLEILDLHYNKLSSLPQSLGNIKSLKEIYIDKQEKEKVPKTISHLLKPI